jgi:hypothetical protein
LLLVGFVFIENGTGGGEPLLLKKKRTGNYILTFNLTLVNQHGFASIEPSVIRISSTCMAEESQERA